MSRTSEKQQHNRCMHLHMGKWIPSRLFRASMEDDDSVEDAKDAAFASMIRVAESSCSLFRAKNHRKMPHDGFVEDMVGCVDDDDEDNEEDKMERELIAREASLLPWLTNEEFIQKHRMSFPSHKRSLSKIKNHDVFKKLEGTRGKLQTPVANQLMVFLKHPGMEGNGASGPNQQNTFGIGKGLADVFCRHVTTAILSLRGVCYTWPDAEERRAC